LSIEALEEWKNGGKGRYVRDLGIDTGYGASCWSLVLGNVDVRPPKGWHVEEKNRAEVFAHEVSFFKIEGDLPPNVVFAESEDPDTDWDWPGLARVIEVAIQRAKELGL
jgi:hypothetical protein